MTRFEKDNIVVFYYIITAAADITGYVRITSVFTYYGALVLKRCVRFIVSSVENCHFHT